MILYKAKNMTENQREKLANLIRSILLDLTRDDYGGRWAKLSTKIIEGMEAEGWTITPPKPKQSRVTQFLRMRNRARAID